MESRAPAEPQPRAARSCSPAPAQFLEHHLLSASKYCIVIRYKTGLFKKSFYQNTDSAKNFLGKHELVG